MSDRIPTTLIFIILFALNGIAQKERILLDGRFDDWSNRDYSFSDPIGDGRFGYDLSELTIENDEILVYFYFDAGIDFNIQENNDFLLILDTDNDYSTGYPVDNMGADLIYAFGDKGGNFYIGSSQYSISHEDIGLITLPSVSSDRFEIALYRNATISGNPVFPEQSFKCMLLQDVQNGDKLPDQSGGVSYIFSDTSLEAIPSYSLEKNKNIDFRLVSYNVLQDRIFEAPASFQRILTALDPDIIAFQEIYTHTAAQTKELIIEWLPGTWYAAKQGNDIITVSKYPILESHYVAGNGAFLLDVDGEEVLLVNAHLPCCDNDAGRQEEVDEIMAFIREAQNGQSSLDLRDKTPILIAGDMNFVGKNRQLRTFLEGDIQNEFVFGEDFHPDWDDTPLVDALAFATQTPLAVTWWNNYSDYSPGRLDYFIYSDAVLRLENTFSLLTSALPQDTLSAYSILKDDTSYASDHFPVVSDFVIDYTNPVASINKIKQLEAYPIPFNEFLNIKSTELMSSNTVLRVNNTNGNLLFETHNISPSEMAIQLTTSHWPVGTYLITLWDDRRLIALSKVLKVE